MRVRSSLASLALAAAAALTGCGASGGAAPAPGAAPAQETVPQSVAIGARPAQLSLAHVASGVSASATIPAATAGSGTLTLQLTAIDPVAAMPSPPKRLPRANVIALAYLTLAANADLTFAASPALTFTVPLGTYAPNGYWLAIYDAQDPGAGWKVIGGPVPAVVGSVSFAAANATFALRAGDEYVLSLLAPGGVSPAPSP